MINIKWEIKFIIFIKKLLNNKDVIFLNDFQITTYNWVMDCYRHHH